MTKSKMLLFSLGLLCNFVVQATNQTFSRYRPEDFLFEDGCNKHVEIPQKASETIDHLWLNETETSSLTLEHGKNAAIEVELYNFIRWLSTAGRMLRVAPMSCIKSTTRSTRKHCKNRRCNCRCLCQLCFKNLEIMTKDLLHQLVKHKTGSVKRIMQDVERKFPHMVKKNVVQVPKLPCALFDDRIPGHILRWYKQQKTG